MNFLSGKHLLEEIIWYCCYWYSTQTQVYKTLRCSIETFLQALPLTIFHIFTFRKVIGSNQQAHDKIDNDAVLDKVQKVFNIPA